MFLSCPALKGTNFVQKFLFGKLEFLMIIMTQILFVLYEYCLFKKKNYIQPPSGFRTEVIASSAVLSLCSRSYRTADYAVPLVQNPHGPYSNVIFVEMSRFIEISEMKFQH